MKTDSDERTPQSNDSEPNEVDVLITDAKNGPIVDPRVSKALYEKEVNKGHLWSVYVMVAFLAIANGYSIPSANQMLDILDVQRNWATDSSQALHE